MMHKDRKAEKKQALLWMIFIITLGLTTLTIIAVFEHKAVLESIIPSSTAEPTGGLITTDGRAVLVTPSGEIVGCAEVRNGNYRC